MNYRVVVIPQSVTSRVRAQRKDPVYKYPAHTEVATGYGPCRQCLQFFTVGVDRRILFTHDAFLGVDTLRQPGPVFIHEDECTDFAGAFPVHLREHSLTFEAYGTGRELRETQILRPNAGELPIERLFSRPDVDYIIVRDTDAGCFDCAIVRD